MYFLASIVALILFHLCKKTLEESSITRISKITNGKYQDSDRKNKNILYLLVA